MARHCFLYSILFLLCLSASLQATTWQSRTFGNWENSNTWIGNVVPPYTTHDTFIIDHPIIIAHNIAFTAGASIIINTGGGLCGHHNIKVDAGAGILKYGILELDTLFIPGGSVLCRAPGDVILTRYGIISNNGQMDVNGCSLAVGPWFSCKLPEYSFATPVSINTYSAPSPYHISPNPSGSQFILHGKITDNETSLELMDQLGRVVYSQKLQSDNLDQHPILTELPSGTYLWQLRFNTVILEKGKLCIIP